MPTFPADGNTPSFNLHPFDNIALACSGGGFRAASFSMGVFSCLEAITDARDVPLMRRVSYLSSASGGTIATALYALHNAQGKTFATFYKKAFASLQGLGLLDEVMQVLNDDDAWNACPGKSRNMINAFALAYHKILFEGAHLADLQRGPENTHLDEVCFNTTEFYTGLLFRQACKMRPDLKEAHDTRFVYGNFLIHLDRSEASGLRLADILAASSCFPAGFEPISFPSDFAYSREQQERIIRKFNIRRRELDWAELDCLQERPVTDVALAELGPGFSPRQLQVEMDAQPLRPPFKVGFMDGGITDNQGLESMMKAQERRRRGETSFRPFGLMLVNDVGSHFMDPYQVQEPGKRFKGVLALSIHNVLVGCGVTVALCIVAAFWISRPGIDGAWQVLPALLGAAAAALFGGLMWTRRAIASKLANGGGLNLNENFSPAITRRMLHHFGNTPIGVLRRMLLDRFNSVITLNNNVFLKRIRRLLYQRFFDSEPAFTVKSNHIYDLAWSNDTGRAESDLPQYAPSEKLQNVAQAAFEMGTTLWFSREDDNACRMAAIIATGQATTCYNLLQYIGKMKDGDTPHFDRLDAATQADVNALQRQLLAHWERYCADPFWLYNELGEDYGIPGFEKQGMSAFPFPKNFARLRTAPRTEPLAKEPAR